MPSVEEQHGPMTIHPLDFGGYTIADLEAMPDDEGLRYELDDGCLVVSPPPLTAHNIAATELAFLLQPALREDYRVVVEGSLLFDGATTGSRTCSSSDVPVPGRPTPHLPMCSSLSRS
jgi:hypothetical protein